MGYAIIYIVIGLGLRKGILALVRRFMNRERWKDVPGYEGKYQINTCGRIRSLKR